MTEPNNNPLHGVTLEQILTALVAHVLVRHAAVVLDLGAELGAGGAEEIGLVLDVGLADQAVLRHV